MPVLLFTWTACDRIPATGINRAVKRVSRTLKLSVLWHEFFNLSFFKKLYPLKTQQRMFSVRAAAASHPLRNGARCKHAEINK